MRDYQVLAFGPMRILFKDRTAVESVWLTISYQTATMTLENGDDVSIQFWLISDARQGEALRAIDGHDRQRIRLLLTAVARRAQAARIVSGAGLLLGACDAAWGE